MLGAARSALLTRGPCLATRLKHTLPDLPYDYGALEPVISGAIMEVHHQKHHATYVNKLNEIEEKMQEAMSKEDVQSFISLGKMLKFNGGGHINHCIFWTNLAKDGGEPGGQLTEAINRDFGSLQTLKEKMSTLAEGVQGSGWAWLGYNKEMKRLQLAKCKNQHPLEPTTGLIPLLGIDVWEHAYYLQYKSARPDYVKAIWEIINWKNVEERLDKAVKGG